MSSSTLVGLLGRSEVSVIEPPVILNAYVYLVENLAAGTGSSYGITEAVKSWTDEVCKCIICYFYLEVRSLVAIRYSRI